MKRILSLVLALSMVLSMFSFAFAGTFADLEGTKYEAAAGALFELGIAKGKTEDTFAADESVKRSEMAAFLVRASGLEAAAESSKGATSFSDVAANHWASGYINIATQYGLINGYPDGTFAPDAEVSYAEAVTMAIRALGFKTVVEAKGTWPTNYIAKAQELDVLEGIKYSLYTQAAVRGDIALLTWNTLTTPTWDVNGENENNGLSYGVGDTMIEKYFADYTYAKVDFVDFAISEGKVVIELDDTESEVKLDKADGKYEYAGADFFTFVPGTEVEVLVNEEEETLLLIIPTGEDTLVEGTVADLTDPDGSAYTLSGDSGDKEYAYGILGRNKVVVSTRFLDVESEYIFKVEEKADKWVKLNEKSALRFSYDTVADTERVFVKDGALVSFEDVEEGDILTKVSCHADEYFYVVSCEEVSGKLEAYNVSTGKIEIGKAEYDILASATYVVDTTDEDASQTAVLASATGSHADMKNEVITAYVDFFGAVVRVEFDGELGEDEEEDSSFGFYAVKSWVEKASARKYDVVLENENGKDTYVFADDSRSVATTIMTNQESSDIRNTIYYVEFNADREIVAMEPISAGSISGDSADEVTVVFNISGDKYLEDKSRFSGDSAAEIVKVSNSTYVVVISVEDGENVDVTFDRDVELLANIDVDDLVTVVYEKDDETITPTAKYVILSEVNAKSSDLFALVIDKYEDNVYGNTLVIETEDGERITYKGVSGDVFGAVNEDNIIKYETETDKDGEVSITSALEVVNASTYNWAAIVAKVNGLEAELTLPAGAGTLLIDMSDEDTLKSYEDYRILSVNYDYDEVGPTYTVESFEEIEIDEVKFVKDDLFFDYTYIDPANQLMVILSK